MLYLSCENNENKQKEARLGPIFKLVYYDQLRPKTSFAVSVPTSRPTNRRKEFKFWGHFYRIRGQEVGSVGRQDFGEGNVIELSRLLARFIVLTTFDVDVVIVVVIRAAANFVQIVVCKVS